MPPLPRSVILPILAAMLIVGAAGCAGPRRAITLDLSHAVQIEPDRFAAGRALLMGAPAPIAGERWQPGDSVLLGIALDAGDVRAEWYLRATAAGKVSMQIDGHTFNMRDSVRVRRAGSDSSWVRVEYDVVVVKVELFDASAQLLSESEAMMPEVCLEYGLYDYIELALAGTDPFASGPVTVDTSGELVAGDDLRRAVAGWIAIMKLPEFLQRDRAMDQLIWRMIDRPGLFSIIANRGVQMEVGLNGKDARPEFVGAMPGLAYRVPVALTLNGRQAVQCEIVVMRGDAPLGPCNGLICLDAVHPSDPSRRLAVRLLAAQRGAGQAVATSE